MKRCALLVALAVAAPAFAQLAAQPPRRGVPAWDKGIQPISRESYYNAMECGKKGGENPACVFWDAGLCRNPEFVVSMYTPYKMVAYEVWHAVHVGQPPPTPSYPEAQRTRVTIGVTPVPASKNPISTVDIRHGDQVFKPTSQAPETGGGRFTFDFDAWAPTGDMTIEFVGRAKTVTCRVPQAVLSQFR